MISNYPGTTVEFTQGELKTGTETFEILDSPGTYSLTPTCRAEEVTAELVEHADIIINIVNATNLERNLFLTTQLLERGIPMVIALNMFDKQPRRNNDKSGQAGGTLGVPVYPTVAIGGEGQRHCQINFREKLKETLLGHGRWSEWKPGGKVQIVSHRPAPGSRRCRMPA